MQCYAADNGYNIFKGKSNCGLAKFNSKIQKTDDELTDANVIEYENERYVVGIGKDDIQNDKTRGLVHKICTLKALADVTEKEREFHLILDLPLLHYKNKTFRDEFENYMACPETNKIKQHGKIKEIIIKKCTVMPQGISALYANDPRRYKGKLVAVLDIGGKTIDGCVVENLKPIKETMFTINHGTMILENQIKNALNEAFLFNIQDYEIPYLIKDGIPELETESKIVIENVLNEYFDTLIREMIAKNWSIETLSILGIGGGILRLKDVINFYLPNLKHSESPLFDNALGLYNIGRMMENA